MKDLKKLGLTDNEIDFVNRVYENPRSKMINTDKWIDDGSEHGTMIYFWKKPEELGLIKAVGSYRWETTAKVKMVLFFDDSNEVDK